MARAITRKVETVTVTLYSKANKAKAIKVTGEPGKELDDKVAATRNVLETLFNDVVEDVTTKGIKYSMSQEEFIKHAESIEPYEITQTVENDGGNK